MWTWLLLFLEPQAQRPRRTRSPTYPRVCPTWICCVSFVRGSGEIVARPRLYLMPNAKPNMFDTNQVPSQPALMPIALPCARSVEIEVMAIGLRVEGVAEPTE